MIIHAAPQFNVYFGDAKDDLYPDRYHAWDDAAFFSHKPIASIVDRLRLQNLYFLRQVHGICGSVVSKKNLNSLSFFSQEGDFLITHEPQIGLGIVTADCLPVVAYDYTRHVIGIAHAGWRGAINGVVLAMIYAMKKEYETDSHNLRFFFGPSAKRCCYEVQPAFLAHLEAYTCTDQVIHSLGKKLFFDLPLFVEMQLMQEGVKTIGTEYNACTICDTRFYSYRRGMRGGTAQSVGRQMTVVAIK